MILVTQRALQKTIEGALHKHWNGRVRPIRVVRTLLEARRCDPTDPVTRRHTFLVLDLEQVTNVQAVSDTLALYPWLYLVMVMSGREMREQVAVMESLKTRFPRSSFVWSDELGKESTWTTLYRQAMVAQHGPAVEALVRKGLDSDPPATDLVFRVLHAAPLAADVYHLAEILGYSRHTLWQHLKTAGQRDPKDLIALFQLVYAAHLKQLKWSSGMIASYLGMLSAREFGRRTVRKFEVCLPQLLEHSAERIGTWVAWALLHPTIKRPEWARLIVTGVT